MNTPSPEHLDLCIRHTLEMPMAQSVGLRVVERSEGRAVCHLDVTESASVGSGHLNGGELYAMLDYVAYLAVASLMPETEAAVTHDLHVSVISAAPRGAVVEVSANVIKRGRTTAFIRVEARSGEGDTARPVALATVTKTILPMAVRTRHSK